MRSPLVLVDTDVVSFLFKGDSRADDYLPELENCIPVVSFMTVAELDRWALQHNWGEARRQRLESYLTAFTVRYVDRSLCSAWAEVTVQARSAGRPIQCADAWIAATARLHHLPLLTHNPDDFRGVTGLRLVSSTDASPDPEQG
jgi:tRNA(fMet)-specific endonuclease VapC